MKMSKTAQGVQKLKDGDLKGALSVFSTFKYDLTREERRTIQMHTKHYLGIVLFIGLWE